MHPTTIGLLVLSRAHDAAVALAALALVACGSLALAGCGSSEPAGGAGAGGSGPGAAPAAARLVVTAVAESTAYERTLELGGTLEAPERVEIAARVEGAIVSLGADLGDRVERGDVLARITPDDFAARAAQTEAELAQARTEAARAEQLVANDLATRESLEQSRTKVQIAQSQRALAGRQLRDTRVLAPFDGAIAERLVSPGAFVRIGTPLFVLVATSPLRLAIEVPERLAAAVRTGTTITLGADGASPVDATVTRVSPVIDPTTRTFRALVEVEVDPDAPAALRPGMYVRARMALGLVEDAVRVPRAAVFEVLGRSRVVEVIDGHARPRDVELVGEENGVAIVRGLAPGAVVVARGAGLLSPGAEVSVQADAPATPEEAGPAGAVPPGEADATDEAAPTEAAPTEAARRAAAARAGETARESDGT